MALGAGAYRELLEAETVSADVELQAAVREVGERIAAVAERPDYQWEFALIEADEANALALPGGKVVVYTGLLPFAQNSAGLAAVIGHEVAHALARHGAERLSQRRIIDALASGATAAIGLPGLGHLAVLALGLGVQVGYELPFSRAQELEADHIGLILMARAGYDPQQALYLWQRFAAAEKQTIEFLSTHPSPATRLEDMRLWLPEAQAYFQAPGAAPVRELGGAQSSTAPRMP